MSAASSPDPAASAGMDTPAPAAAAAVPAAASADANAVALAEDLGDVVAGRAVLCVTGPEPTAAVEGAIEARSMDAAGLTAVWLRPQTPGDRSAMTRALYTALGLERHRLRPRILADAEELIAAELRRSARLVVVPDAHLLRTDALQLLYGMWAHGAPNCFPVVLAGDDRLDRVLKRPALAGLATSVHIRHRLPATGGLPSAPAPAPSATVLTEPLMPSASPQPADAAVPGPDAAAATAEGAPRAVASAPDGAAVRPAAAAPVSGAAPAPASAAGTADTAGAGLSLAAPVVAGPLLVSVARQQLYKLVDAARDKDEVALVAKGKSTVALVPVARLAPVSRARLGSWPSWARTAARPKLGDLVRDAAGTPSVPGVPQVLCDRTTPVAVLVDAALLPADGGLVVVPGGPGGGGAAPAADGGASAVLLPADGPADGPVTAPGVPGESVAPVAAADAVPAAGVPGADGGGGDADGAVPAPAPAAASDVVVPASPGVPAVPADESAGSAAPAAVPAGPVSGSGGGEAAGAPSPAVPAVEAAAATSAPAAGSFPAVAAPAEGASPLSVASAPAASASAPAGCGEAPPAPMPEPGADAEPAEVEGAASAPGAAVPVPASDTSASDGTASDTPATGNAGNVPASDAAAPDAVSDGVGGDAPEPETTAPGAAEDVPAPDAAPDMAAAAAVPVPPARPRTLRGLDDHVLDELLAPTAPATTVPRAGGPVAFGLPALDHALATLTPGRLTLIAAAPGAGGSLLAAAAARHTALTHQLPVLYAASGLTRADVAARIVAAHAPVDYRRLRTNALTATELAAAAGVRAQLAAAPLLIDDGTDLTAAAIAATVPDVEGLALVVVDRLQHTHDPAVPLSGPALPAAARTLAHLARTHGVPVLAVLDTDDPAAVAALAPGLTLTLGFPRGREHAELVVAERDFGRLAAFPLTADFSRARFTEPVPRFDALRAFSGPRGEEFTAALVTAARPYMAPGALGELPEDLRWVLQALVRRFDGQDLELSSSQRAVTEAAARGLRLPETADGRRLAAALGAFVEHAVAHGYRPGTDAHPDTAEHSGTTGHGPDTASTALGTPYGPAGPSAGPSRPPVAGQAVTGPHSPATSTTAQPGRPAAPGLPAADSPQDVASHPAGTAPAEPAAAPPAPAGPAAAAPHTGPAVAAAAPGPSTPAPAGAPALGPVGPVAGAGEDLAAAEAELLEAAHPFLAGAQGGLSARLMGTMAALRDARTTTAGREGTSAAASTRPEPAGESVLVGLRRTMAELAARTPRMPETAEGARLHAALAAYATAHSGPAAPALTASTPAPATAQDSAPRGAGHWPMRFPPSAALRPGQDAPADGPAAPAPSDAPSSAAAPVGPDGPGPVPAVPDDRVGVEAELLAAAQPFLGGGQDGLSRNAEKVLYRLRAALTNGDPGTVGPARAEVLELAGRRLRLPNTPEGARLRTALDTYATVWSTPATGPARAAVLSVAEPAPAPAEHQPAAAAPDATPVPAAAAPGDHPDRAGRLAPAPEAPEEEASEVFQDTTAPPEADLPASRTSARVYTFFLNKITAAVDQALEEAQGDIETATKALIRKAVPDSMALFKLTRVGANYVHTVYPRLEEFLTKPAQGSPDQVWEGRHKWRNQPLADAIRKGTHEPLDVTALDTNAAYLSAFKTHLPIGALQHDPTGTFDRRRAGIHRVDHFEWTHPHLPNPLGGRVEPGPYYLDDATLRLLIRCHEKFGLCEAPRILESWTSGASEALLEKFRRVLQQARTTAIETNDTVTLEYVKAMYSRFTSTIGESGKNTELRRPEWVHTIRSQAFASLWLKAWKAHENDLILVQVSGVDELHVAGGDWRQVFKEGRQPDEMKEKRLYTLGGK
ncbi:DnaB-like helicase C-terminal domain-containing protein [Streptomyces klenkii]|uniref:DnaB-like helicase C-terminal domain-containing protein n=1 Tax=Streptomyces klenkii TaxID=1420899 RepID=UPI00342C9D25